MITYIYSGVIIAVFGTVAFLTVMSIDPAKLGDPVDQYLRKDIRQMKNSVLTISTTLFVLCLWSFIGALISREVRMLLISVGFVLLWGGVQTFREFKRQNERYKKYDPQNPRDGSTHRHPGA